MDEAECHRRGCGRIATDPAARGLLDDVARARRPGHHPRHDRRGRPFPALDPPASVGWKLVAVNLSRPRRQGRDAGRGAAVADHLRATATGRRRSSTASKPPARATACALIGGDTIALPEGAPRVLGLTAIGRAGPRIPVARRRQARRSAVAGRHARRCRRRPRAAARRRATPTGRWSKPTAGRCRCSPPARRWRRMRTAMMDVSDGLLLDARRLAEASGCGAIIDLDALPLSRAFIAERGDDRRGAAVRGDRRRRLCAARRASGRLRPVNTFFTSGDHDRAHRDSRRRRRIASASSATAKPVALPESLGHEHRGNSAPPVADRA